MGNDSFDLDSVSFLRWFFGLFSSKDREVFTDRSYFIMNHQRLDILLLGPKSVFSTDLRPKVDE